VTRSAIVLNSVLGVALAAVVATAAFSLGSSDPATASTEQTETVARGDVTATVSATGNLTAATEVGVDFAGSGGIVTDIYVEVGQTVQAGDRLARIDNSAQRQAVASARNSLAQAVANADQSGLTLDAARRNLREAERNQKLNKDSYDLSVSAASKTLADAQFSWSDACLTPEGSCPDGTAWAQLRAAEADVERAQTSYDQAVQTTVKTAETNQVKLNQAKVNVDAARSTQQTQCDTFGSSSSACTTAVSQLLSAEQGYELQTKANEAADVAGQQSLANTSASITSANIALRKLQSSLRSAADDAVRSAQSTLDSALVTQRKGLEADRQAVDAAREAVAQQSAATQTVTIQSRSVTPGQASIDAARAGLTSAQKALADTVLRAPVSGTVASIAGAVGESSTAAGGADSTTSSSESSGYMVITGLDQLQVTSRVAEADASRIRVGQVATVTFSAAGTSVDGVVSAIDVLDTVTNNVVEYGVTVTLLDPPKSLKLGQTASVSIVTGSAIDVLNVSSSAVTRLGGVATVSVRQPDGTSSPVQVQTGLEGGDRIEIVSGLAEGEVVVLPATSGLPAGFTFPAGVGGGLGGGLG